MSKKNKIILGSIIVHLLFITICIVSSPHEWLEIIIYFGIPYFVPVFLIFWLFNFVIEKGANYNLFLRGFLIQVGSCLILISLIYLIINLIETIDKYKIRNQPFSDLLIRNLEDGIIYVVSISILIGSINYCLFWSKNSLLEQPK